MYDARTRLAAQVAQEVRDHFGDLVLQAVIPRSVRLSEAPSYQQTVMQYDATSPGALSYAEAARELAAQQPGASTAGNGRTETSAPGRALSGPVAFSSGLARSGNH
jgi:chromosome partitioning protein